MVEMVSLQVAPKVQILCPVRLGLLLEIGATPISYFPGNRFPWEELASLPPSWANACSGGWGPQEVPDRVSPASLSSQMETSQTRSAAPAPQPLT